MAYGLAWLDFLTSPSGMSIKPELVLFNWGMHDVPLNNNSWPGQNAPPDNYAAELNAITFRLVTATTGWGAKLLFAHTTSFISTAQQDGCVQNLNKPASAIMAAAGVPCYTHTTLFIAGCGEAPQSSCFGLERTNVGARTALPRGGVHVACRHHHLAESACAIGLGAALEPT